MIARALGVDFGEARIGLAISDQLGMLAHPLETITVQRMSDVLERIAEIVVRDAIATIVLGLPRNMDGTYGAAAEKCRAFAEKLRARIDCPVILWDERLTTVAAQKSLHAAGRSVKQSRSIIDQVAAQMILQGWLDAQAQGRG